MKRTGALAALALSLFLSAAPAFARDSYVIDQASMLSPATVTALNQRIASFNAQTGKEVVVQTVPSLGGSAVRDAAGKAFSDLGVNGVLIFIAKDDRKDFIVPDSAGARAGWFSPAIFAPIYQGMGAQFKNEDYNGGVTTAVDSVLGIYRSHLNSLGGSAGAAAPVRTNTYNSYANSPTGGFHLSGFWLIALLVVAFLVIRSILRAISAPRPPAGYSGPPAAPGPGYGAQGYGPGYGGMGGGGNFFSGLLGGLGGAFLGNELFGGRGGNFGGGNSGGDPGGSWGGGGSAPDAGGWSSDAGQGDTSAGGGGGDWGGGGFGDGGGGGGGGGDSGGGW